MAAGCGRITKRKQWSSGLPAHFDLMRVARARRDIISVAMADPDDRPATGLTVPSAMPGEASDPFWDRGQARCHPVGQQRASCQARLVRTRRAVAAQARHPHVRRGAPEGHAPTAAE